MEEKRVPDILSIFDKLTENPHNFLGTQSKSADKFKKITKDLYDLTKSCEHEVTPTGVLPNLIIKDFDEEQIWQEIELQNDFSVTDLLENISKCKTIKSTLSFRVGDRDSKNSNKKINKYHTNPADNDSNDDIGSDYSDEELTKIKSRLEREEDSDSNGSADDLDFDFDAAAGQLENFEDLEGNNSENISDDQDDGSFHNNVEHSSKSQSIIHKSSVVDDQFFKLSELENFLNKEDLKEEKKIRQEKSNAAKDDDEDSEDDDEELDVFNDDFSTEDEEESARDLKYKDFFDAPFSLKKKVKFASDKTKSTNDLNVEEADALEEEDHEAEGSDEEAEEDPDDESPDEGSDHRQLDSKDLLAESESEGEDVSDVLGGGKSNFEKRQEKLKKKITDLEEQSLKPKTWQLSGEVASGGRPENSILEEDLQFEHATRLAPVITEETTATLEELIIQRIKDKAWDDVERKTRKKEEPFEYKKRVLLDQEKSKLSLAEVYEQEYLKKQEDEEEKEEPKHAEIRKMMQSLFMKLDALSNFHYTPKQATAEVQIVSNQPSIAMEEVAPVTMSKTDMLAPEEIEDKTKEEEKGSTEKTPTDRKRARRKKKTEKRKKIKEKEAKQKLVDKMNPGLGNKYSKVNAMKKLEKESKIRGDITLIKDTKKKTSLTSSKEFFTQLQDEVKTQIRAKKAEKRKASLKYEKSSKKFKL